MSHFDIIIGSTLGNAEYLAEHIAEQLSTHEVTLHFTPKESELTQNSIWLIVCSTHGAGELPENIQPFIKKLNDPDTDLSHQKFLIVAIGDRNYDTYCAAGKQIHDLLLTKKATPIYSMLEIDTPNDPDPEHTINDWLNAWKNCL